MASVVCLYYLTTFEAQCISFHSEETKLRRINLYPIHKLRRKVLAAQHNTICVIGCFPLFMCMPKVRRYKNWWPKIREQSELCIFRRLGFKIVPIIILRRSIIILPYFWQHHQLCETINIHAKGGCDAREHYSSAIFVVVVGKLGRIIRTIPGPDMTE